jgi:hypothetical protein
MTNKQRSYYGLIWAWMTRKELTEKEKDELFDIMRAYLAIPAFWIIYYGKGIR